MEKWYFWSNKMFILCIRIFQIFWRWTKMPFEMETLYICIGKFDFIIFEMQFLQLFKRLYPQKAFWRRLISGFYLSCQKIILNSTGNLKLFWLIKIGSKISPWLFLSFLKDDLWYKKRYDAALLWPKIGHCSKRPCYLLSLVTISGQSGSWYPWRTYTYYHLIT